MKTVLSIFFALALAAGFLALAGCSSPPASGGEPQYAPQAPPVSAPKTAPAEANNAPTAPAPNTTTGTDANVNSSVGDTSNVSAGGSDMGNLSAAGEANLSLNASANDTNMTAAPNGADKCLERFGEEAIQCMAKEATAQKDVRVCTRLADKAGRFKCITIWCYSPGRNYNACYTLDNVDDRTGCLNKCNPNPNT